MKNYTGIQLYQGPSMLTGEPVVAIATVRSQNAKTGDMIQTWILNAEEDPLTTTKTGSDQAVCGQCPHRHYLGGGCYVTPWQAPSNIYKSWKDGRYPIANKRHINRLRGRAIRLGSYGDPAAVPFSVWKSLIDVASFTTGYTHQPDTSEDLLSYAMVSVESEDQAAFWQAKGYRTFRIKSQGEDKLAGEIVCPASVSADVQCIDCGICNGGTKGSNVVIDAHGSRKKRVDNIIAAA